MLFNLEMLEIFFIYVVNKTISLQNLFSSNFILAINYKKDHIDEFLNNNYNRYRDLYTICTIKRNQYNIL